MKYHVFFIKYSQIMACLIQIIGANINIVAGQIDKILPSRIIKACLHTHMISNIDSIAFFYFARFPLIMWILGSKN